MYDTTRSDQAPWRQAGQSALSSLTSQLPDITRQFTTNDFHEDPGYQFNLQQGQQAIQRSAAARGLLNSTGTMKNMANYSQGMASNEFQNAYNRFTQNQQQRYNTLAGIAGIGQNANNSTAASGANYANQAGENMKAVGNANAAASMQGYNGMTNLASQGLQAGMLYAMI